MRRLESMGIHAAVWAAAACLAGAALADNHLAGETETAADEAAAAAVADEAEAAATEVARASRRAVDEITITARKREESLQTVPISVTAFGGDQLEDQQIDDTTDIQFRVPNFTFNKTNFTGSNLQIRGIGSAVVAASGEAAVGVHVNNVPFAPRLFEQEFYDVERIEVLRGPQGTLFGRNSTGGTFNIWTHKPTHEFETEAELLYGNFSAVKGKAAVNIPINDRVRTRISGMIHDRDGYLTNNFTNNNIDDRFLYGVRGSLEVDVTDDTVVNLMLSWFEEDDARSRIGKQLCNTDSSPFPLSIGCEDGPLEFDTITSYGTLGGIIETAALPLFGGAALYTPGLDTNATADNPADLRRHNSRFDPDYEVDELLGTLEVNHHLSEHTLSFNGGFQRTRSFSMQDYTMVVPGIAWDSGAIQDNFVAAGGDVGAGTTGLLAVDDIDNPTQICFGGEIGCHDRSFSFDKSTLDLIAASGEVRISSQRDSDFNYTIGSIYSHSRADTNYFVFFSGAEVLGAVLGLPPELRHFNTESKPALTHSFGLFGEVYYDVTEDLKVTLGGRYTYDYKRVRSRQNLLAPLPEFDKRTADWHAGTGRLTVDYNLDNDVTDQTLFYASASRGYKPGGFNPAVDPMLFPDVPETFDPETIWAYEVGTKNRYVENRAQTNVSVFFYDYRDYQISKIEARTAINENIDAYVWGAELEFLAVPFDPIQFDFSLAYLGSDIRSGESVDPADPTAGDPTLLNVKNLEDGSNEVILAADAGDPVNAPRQDAVAKSLVGRELPNTPDIQINVGGQYTHELPWEASVTGRISYYYQTEMFGRMFNESRDEIDSWSQADALLRYEQTDGQLYIDFWVKNIADNDDITAHYLTDASSGNFTNVFILEPRTFGVTVGGRY